MIAEMFIVGIYTLFVYRTLHGPATHRTTHDALRCHTWTLNPRTHSSTLPDMARRDGAIGPYRTIDTPYNKTQCSEMPDMDPKPPNTPYNTAQHTVL